MKKLLSTIFLSCSPFVAFASNGGAASLPIYDLLLLPLSLEFSGPLPLALGTIGLAVAAITFLSGCHHQEGAKRFIRDIIEVKGFNRHTESYDTSIIYHKEGSEP